MPQGKVNKVYGGFRVPSLTELQLILGWLSKKTVYLILSIGIMAFLLLSFLTDASALVVTEDVEKTTQTFTFTIFFLHSVLFFLALAAYVFSSKFGGKKSFRAWLCLLILIANTVLFALRIALEIVYIGYREELYTINEQ